MSSYVLSLVRRHRIATRAITDFATAFEILDPEAADRLAAHARKRRFAALHRTGWMVTISRALADGNIRHLGIKGPILAIQLYGDPAARDSKDIDLLIDPAKLRQGAAILIKMGFHDTSNHDEAGERFANKHRTFVGHGVEVELHTRLLDVDALLPLSFDVVWPRREKILLGSNAVPVLSNVDTLLYLCGHGAQHLWFRLKWLEDVARIVVMDRTESYAGILDQALNVAQRVGALPVVTSALHLVTDVLRIATPPVTLTRASRRIVRLSIAALDAPAEVADAPPLGWILRKIPVQFGMTSNWRYRRDLLLMLALAPRDFDTSHLPPGLRWLRLPLRPVMLVSDRWLRGRSRSHRRST